MVSEKRYVLNVRHFKFKFQKGSLNLTYVPVKDWYTKNNEFFGEICRTR